MSLNVPFQERQIWSIGATLAVLEVQFMQDNMVDPKSIVNGAVEFAFWYVNAAEPHKIALGVIFDGPNGKARYMLDGTETPTKGNLIWQATYIEPGSLDQSIQTFASQTTPPFKVTVLDAAA